MFTASTQQRGPAVGDLREKNGLCDGGGISILVGPSVGCLLAMCRAAGFARVELLHTESYNALVACYRKWEPPQSISVANNGDQGINFSSRTEQYISCWFHSSREAITKEDLRLEVDQVGVASYWIGRQQGDMWSANFPLPPTSRT